MSVFAAIKSTPVSFPSIIVLRAFPPPPPAPITLIRAPLTTASSTSSNMSAPFVLDLEYFIEPLPHSLFHLVVHIRIAASEDPIPLVPAAVQNQSHAGPVHRTLHDVDHPADILAFEVYLGVDRDDAAEDVAALADKLSGLRIFPDEEGRLNRDVRDALRETIRTIRSTS